MILDSNLEDFKLEEVVLYAMVERLTRWMFVVEDLIHQEKENRDDLFKSRLASM